MFSDDFNLACVPKYYGDDLHNDRSYLMLEYLDSTIQDYIHLEPFNGKLSLRDIALQSFNCLWEIHKVYHLHRDVKPDNFMISMKDNKVKIIDFGLVIDYMPNGRDGAHRPLGKYSFQGTARYGSINTLMGYNSGRRDDLEGLGYSIMALIDEKLMPWNDIPGNKTKEIAASKLNFLQCDAKELPSKFVGIRDFIRECYQTQYEAEPNYMRLESLLRDAFSR